MRLILLFLIIMPNFLFGQNKSKKNVCVCSVILAQKQIKGTPVFRITKGGYQPCFIDDIALLLREGLLWE